MTCCCNTSRQEITPCLQVGQQVTRHIAATNRFVFYGELLWNLCFFNRVLLPQQVAQIQPDLILYDLWWWQNSVAKTKIFTKILQYTWGDLSPRCNAATCCLECEKLGSTLSHYPGSGCSNIGKYYISVVVNFYLRLFLFFFCFNFISIHHHTQKQKKNKKLPEIRN